MKSHETQAFFQLIHTSIFHVIIYGRPNDVSMFIPNKAQSTSIVTANSAQAKCSTGHFLFQGGDCVVRLVGVVQELVVLLYRSSMCCLDWGTCLYVYIDTNGLYIPTVLPTCAKIPS